MGEAICLCQPDLSLLFLQKMKEIFHQTPGIGLCNRINMVFIQPQKIVVITFFKKNSRTVYHAVIDVVKFPMLQWLCFLNYVSFFIIPEIPDVIAYLFCKIKQSGNTRLLQSVSFAASLVPLGFVRPEPGRS